MTATLASHILDAIRDHLHLHVGFYQWTRDDGVSLWVCSARDDEGQRWVAKHEDFYGAAALVRPWRKVPQHGPTSSASLSGDLSGSIPRCGAKRIKGRRALEILDQQNHSQCPKTED
ncbi:MAG: hypothetical protein IID31_12870 [Planctomycetes bacterium]|nr:hypothetical protein [Planctomycetota bacterium]